MPLPQTMRRLGVCLLVSLLALAGCGRVQGVSQSIAAAAQNLSAFGSMDALIASANAEGALNLIGLPRDKVNYDRIIDAFKAMYPHIMVNEFSPDAADAEEIADAAASSGQASAPDVFELDLPMARASIAQFAPYEVSSWAEIPDSLKEPGGLYYADYGGYMSIGVDTNTYKLPTTLNNLLDSDYQGAVAIGGDPAVSSSAFGAVGLAAVLSGGTLDDFTPGIDFFTQLNAAGNFITTPASNDTVADGSTPVVFDWDYMNTPRINQVATWQTVILPGTGYSAYRYQAINAQAPHPAAARLWEEFLYSDPVQNLYLAAGARPVRLAGMRVAGTADQDAVSALLLAPQLNVAPTAQQYSAAVELLTRSWASAIG